MSVKPNPVDPGKSLMQITWAKAKVSLMKAGYPRWLRRNMVRNLVSQINRKRGTENAATERSRIEQASSARARAT